MAITKDLEIKTIDAQPSDLLKELARQTAEQHPATLIEGHSHPRDGVTVWLVDGSGVNFRYNQDDEIIRTRIDQHGDPILPGHGWTPQNL